MIEASCHCGNVTIFAPNTIDIVTQCNCSACSRYAALWAYFRPKEVKVSVGEKGVARYCWGDKTIAFNHCKHCGCLTHYTPTALGNVDKMAINARMIDPTLVNDYKIRYFDGADSWLEVEKF